MAHGLDALPLVKVGAWAAPCCHLDLYPITDEEEAESIRQDLLEAEMGWHVWATREEALNDRTLFVTAEEWEVDRQLMLADPTLCGSVAIAEAKAKAAKGE